MFMDGPQTATWTSSDLTAGLLAGAIIFCSQTRQTGAVVNFKDSRLTTLGKDMPALWFGNTVATANLYNTELNTASGILAVANYSQVTQDFDYFASYTDNPMLLPAIATINVAESHLKGDLVAYNSSSISWFLSGRSTWTGKAYPGYGGKASFSVHLDKTSQWTLTDDTKLANFTDADGALNNIRSRGFSILYDRSAKANQWLAGKTVKLAGGGVAKPY
jgi:hypothetical protein